MPSQITRLAEQFETTELDTESEDAEIQQFLRERGLKKQAEQPLSDDETERTRNE